MSATTYTPRPDTLPARVVGYFRRLPDEELSTADIAIKWQADPKNVAVQLRMAVEAGLLKKDGTVYQSGENIGSIELTPSAIAAVSRPPLRKGHVRTVIDIEAIEFEDAPPEVASPVKPHDRWLAKLRTMPAGKTFTVGYEYRHALRTAVSELRKQGWKMSVLAEGEDKVRVVCVAVPEVQS
jgi:hypothetical protein